MASYWKSVLFAFVLCSSLLFAEDAKPIPAAAPTAAADQLYRSGKYAEAEAAYRAVVKESPTLVRAQTGLVHSLLAQQKLDESLEAANAALASQPRSATLLVANGDVLFRLGEMQDAGQAYLTASQLDPHDTCVPGTGPNLQGVLALPEGL